MWISDEGHSLSIQPLNLVIVVMLMSSQVNMIEIIMKATQQKLTQNYLWGEVAIETRSPHDEPAEDEGDAQQGEQTATCGALITHWSRGQLRILYKHTHTQKEREHIHIDLVRISHALNVNSQSLQRCDSVIL